MIRRVVNIKQSLVVVAVAAMSLCWSCSKDSDSVDGAVQFSEVGDISFSVASVEVEESTSRGASIDTSASDMTSFGVYATSDMRDKILSGEVVTKSSNVWSYSPVAQWESAETASFLAYSPYSEDIYATATFSDGCLSFGHTIEELYDAYDLLVAAKSQRSNEGSNVELTFDHALSAIGFTITSGDVDVVVWGLEFGDIYNTATANIKVGNSIEWSDHSNMWGYGCDSVVAEDGSPQDITSNIGYLLMIPQELPEFSYIRVTYTITETGEKKDAYYALYGSEWEPSMKYTYNIDFSDLYMDITFSVSVTPWGYAEAKEFSTLDDGQVYSPISDDYIDLDIYNTVEALTVTLGERISNGTTDFVVVGTYYENVFGSGGTYDELYDDWESFNISYIPSPFAISSITSLDFSSVKGVTELPGFAFGELSSSLSLEEIILPESITSTGDGAFSACKNLESITLDNIKELGSGAFLNCSSLTKASLPEATTIGGFAFEGCSSLIEISLPKAEAIGEVAFYGCMSLKTISLPAATEIGVDVFVGCSSLTEASLPEATSIGECAFLECALLTEASLPKAETIGKYAFQDCSSLSTIDLSEATTIVEHAFSNCTSLTSISLPKAETIGEHAFSGCTNLTSISLPEAITIGEHAFSEIAIGANIYLTSASEITLYSGDYSSYNLNLYLNEIKGTEDYDGADKYTVLNEWNGYTWASVNIELPEVVIDGNIDLDEYPTYGELLATVNERVEYGVTDFTLTGTYYAGVFGSDVDQWQGSGDDISPFANGLIRSVDLSAVDMNGVTRLPSCAFSSSYMHGTDDNESLTTVVLPSAITTIGACVFYNCLALENINLDNITYIDEYSFYGCKSLESVYMPGDAVVIGYAVFDNCSSLESIYMPVATSIGSYAFNSIASGANIYLTSADPITIGSGTYSSYNLYLNSNKVSECGGYVDDGGYYTTWKGYTWKSITCGVYYVE